MCKHRPRQRFVIDYIYWLTKFLLSVCQWNGCLYCSLRGNRWPVTLNKPVSLAGLYVRILMSLESSYLNYLGLILRCYSFLGVKTLEKPIADFAGRVLWTCTNESFQCSASKTKHMWSTSNADAVRSTCYQIYSWVELSGRSITCEEETSDFTSVSLEITPEHGVKRSITIVCQIVQW